MKFTAEKTLLLAALAHSHRVVERRNTIPILSNVLIVADGDTVSLKTTDLDLELQLKIKAEIHVGGSTTIPAHLLHDIVRKMPDKAEITLAMNDKNQAVTVSAGRSKFNLQCLPESDFPDLNAGTFECVFEIEPAKLRALFLKTQFAMSTEETRYYLNGIYFHVHAASDTNFLRAVATDGHRLALSDVDAPSGSSGMPGVIIPRKTVGEISKLLDGAKSVNVSVNENKMRLEIDDMVLVTKLIDGTFPDYSRVIPTKSNNVAIVSAKGISIASDRVSSVSSERGRAVKMHFSDNNLKLEVNNPDYGSAEDEMEIDYQAEDMQIGFNAKYVQEVIANITSEKARVFLTDAGSPALIMQEGDDRTVFVLMPMRV